jgi:hypothetical protein
MGVGPTQLPLASMTVLPWIATAPAMSSFCAGVVVPIPTLPEK